MTGSDSPLATQRVGRVPAEHAVHQQPWYSEVGYSDERPTASRQRHPVERGPTPKLQLTSLAAAMTVILPQ